MRAHILDTMITPPEFAPARRRSRGCVRAAFLLLLALVWPLVSWAQLQIPGTAPPEPEQAEQPSWQPPDVTALSPDWWSQFETVSPEIAKTRLDRFVAAIEARIPGLDPDNLVTARNNLENLRTLVELLSVTAPAVADEFKPVPTQSSYTLDEILVLQEQLRELERERSQLALQITQTERQVSILRERRENIRQQYRATQAEAPARLLLGINQVAARVEFELNRKQVRQLTEREKQVGERIGLVREQLAFARQNLGTGEQALDDVLAVEVAARNEAAGKNQEVAALQRQLLDALSEEDVNPSLVLLRRQQLTRASAEASLAELQVALAARKAAWHRFKAGELDSEFDIDGSLAEAEALTEATLEQVEVWSESTQTTLVSSPSRSNLNAVKNFEITRSVARDTLDLIEEIRDASNDLLLIQDILSADLIASQSGLSKAWSSTRLAIRSAWSSASGLIDYEIFSLGETPVTPGGIIKMLLILLFAYAISWGIRHLLDRATGRQQFAQSPIFYTLGRLLHYIIILIGIFAALSSIGMNFTNFALIAGALSVGIGFGLQAIVNNFVSGLILLFEGSLRIGDYIELDSGLAGMVKEINTRATVVNSNDGVDVVVPNSELVTTKLTNWTLRESVGRLRISFGVAYGTDKEKVKEAALAAAEEMEFIVLNMRGREPQVRLVNFGDSALEFQLLAWCSRQGVRRPHRVRSSFLWALETKLREAGIEIPFPQRDLHIKEPRPRVEVGKAEVVTGDAGESDKKSDSS
ncbi:MAG: mechanosensitive ion channel [Xanthomonadales bacterium]|nr:mechanosensitive ion channel [Xanthomonadales bacterium]